MSTRNFIVLTMAILTGTLLASEKTSLSGNWTLNESKSTFDQMGAQFLQSKMVVAQTDSDLTIQQTYQSPDQGDMTVDQKVTLDGKECKSEFWNSPRVTTANWSESGDALTIKSVITFERDGQTSVLDITEIWSLAAEGKELQIKHSSSSDWGDRNITMIFDKVEEKK
jgi:hypothetical protein